MEHHAIRIGRIIGMVFVEKLAAWMCGIHQDFEFFAQGFDLVIIQDADGRQVAVFLKKCDLLVAEAILFPVFRIFWSWKQLADGVVVLREIFHSRILPERDKAVYQRCVIALCRRDWLALRVLRGNVIVDELLKGDREFVVAAFKRGEFLAIDVNGAARSFASTWQTDTDVGSL